MIFFLFITTVIFIGYLLLMLFFYIGWKRTPEQFIAREIIPQAFISILIPVRNEEKYIQRILHCLFSQHYPKDKYEIILIDDFSEDKTITIAQSLSIPNLKIMKLAGKTGKKNAITEGIKHALGNLIVTTDADCEMGEEWMEAINSCYQKTKAKLIVSPVLLKAENSVFDIMQSQEMTMLTACAGAALYYNTPILCSGANLAYEKEAFLFVNGYEDNEHISSGDDTFLMFKIHKKFPGKVKYLKSKNAIVYTSPSPKTHSVLKQRKRWASKTFSYTYLPVILIALLVFFTNLLLFFCYILFFTGIINWQLLLLFAAIKILTDCIVLFSANDFLGKKNHTMVFLLASIIYPVYVSVIGVLSPFIPYYWKGRKS